jgi:formylmethanofuran dehydrogenase subunit C
MDDFELEKYVDCVFKTSFGAILRMENGGAIIIRGNAAEILPSLEEYHVKYKSRSENFLSRMNRM